MGGDPLASVAVGDIGVLRVTVGTVEDAFLLGNGNNSLPFPHFMYGRMLYGLFPFSQTTAIVGFTNQFTGVLLVTPSFRNARIYSRPPAFVGKREEAKA